MAHKRNRIIYASQSVWVDGQILYRVQTLGSTTTFTNEDIFELGRLDIVDYVDDVPAVAITLDTNEWGDVKQMAVLAKVDVEPFDSTATSGSNLVVVSGTNETNIFYNGVSLADFGIECGETPGVAMWAPVQDECDLGTDSNDIEMTMFMDEVFVNRLEFNYAIGANYEENYGAETDIKKWFLNDGRFINFDSFTLSGADIANGYVTLTIPSGNYVATTSDGNIAFLKTDDIGQPSIRFYDASEEEWDNYPVASGGAGADTFGFDGNGTDQQLDFPTSGLTPAAGDKIWAIYAADAYGTQTADQYFKLLSESPDETSWRPDGLGAIRQGQAEIYIVDPDTTSSYELALRLTSVRITCDLTREALYEIGHLRPYDRTLTFPIPITVAVETTAGDLENFAKFAGKETEYDAGTLDDIDIIDIMTKEDLRLVALVYYQTDEEAGGTGANRKVDSDSELVGKYYWNAGVKGGPYSGGDREYPLKTIIVEELKATDEAYTLGIKGNATQTFTFRANNDLYAVQGYVPIGHVTGVNKIRRNG